jgi:peptidyl-prolyl cis-trans isomerase SurA
MVFLLVVALLAPAGLCAIETAGQPDLIDRIVAVVDDHVILWSELNYRVRQELEQQGSGAYVDPRTVDALRRKALDEMVNEQVLVLKAQKDSVEVDASEVEEMLNEQYRSLRSSMPEVEFQQMLARFSITERQLKARYRRDIRQRLLYRQMRSQVAYKLHITRRDIDSFVATYRDSLPPQVAISDINLRVRPSDEVLSAKRETVAQIQARLTAGESFAELARQFSEDRGSADQGGDLGCFDVGQLVPEFEAAALKLQPGEISDPVLTKYGYHLIRLGEKREGGLCASHILIMAQPTAADRERVRVRLQELRQRVAAGEGFAQLARQYSENPQLAARGGMWDVFPRDNLPAMLAPHVRGLKLGQVSDPFFLEDGGHIVTFGSDPTTLESLIREIRTTQLTDQMISDYKRQIHIEQRLDDGFLHPPSDHAAGRVPEERGAVPAAQ